MIAFVLVSAAIVGTTYAVIRKLRSEPPKPIKRMVAPKL